ncbi:MAG: cupin domain-containing protein [Armatimonadota bacterium]
MRVVHSREVAAQPVQEEGARNATVRWLLSRPEGAPNFAMRLFELQPGGSTPLHSHAWEHEVFVLEGAAEVVTSAGPAALAAGDAVLVLPDEQHQFRNTGSSPARFLCMIPLT